jgi:hypothetical protein
VVHTTHTPGDSELKLNLHRFQEQPRDDPTDPASNARSSQRTGPLLHRLSANTPIVYHARNVGPPANFTKGWRPSVKSQKAGRLAELATRPSNGRIFILNQRRPGAFTTPERFRVSEREKAVSVCFTIPHLLHLHLHASGIARSCELGKTSGNDGHHRRVRTCTTRPVYGVGWKQYGGAFLFENVGIKHGSWLGGSV